ncbi:MAG: hypothetical protein QOJ32_793, partial [Frankiaceae bacterium]|nr:hypothetical protein [Frankiaceae bacterium]
DGDVAARADEPEGGRQTSQSGTHHDNPVGGTDYGAHSHMLVGDS